MLPADCDVEELTRSVFETVLGLYPETIPDMPPGEVFSWVDISGAWKGTVRVDLSPKLASKVASAMFEAEGVSPAEVIDAIQELANMVGGNVKALLPGPSKLSLPKYEQGSAPPGIEGTRLCFRCGEDWFGVTVEVRREEGGESS